MPEFILELAFAVAIQTDKGAGRGKNTQTNPKLETNIRVRRQTRVRLSTNRLSEIKPEILKPKYTMWIKTRDTIMNTRSGKVGQQRN